MKIWLVLLAVAMVAAVAVLILIGGWVLQIVGFLVLFVLVVLLVLRPSKQ